MARKTVFKRLSKWLNLSSEKWSAAMDVEAADADFEITLPTVSTPVEEEPSVTGSKKPALTERLTSQARKLATPEPAPEPVEEVEEAEYTEEEEEIADEAPVTAPFEPPPPDEEGPDASDIRAQNVAIKCTEAVLIQKGVTHAALSLMVGRQIATRKDLTETDVPVVMPVLAHAAHQARIPGVKKVMLTVWQNLLSSGQPITKESIDRMIESALSPATGSLRPTKGKAALSPGEQSEALYGTGND
jgi:hypothetical protein